MPAAGSAAAWRRIQPGCEIKPCWLIKDLGPETCSLSSAAAGPSGCYAPLQPQRLRPRLENGVVWGRSSSPYSPGAISHQKKTKTMDKHVLDEPIPAAAHLFLPVPIDPEQGGCLCPVPSPKSPPPTPLPPRLAARGQPGPGRGFGVGAAGGRTLFISVILLSCSRTLNSMSVHQSN